MKSLRLQYFNQVEIDKCTRVEHRFVCCFCIEIFSTVENLKAHYVSSHGYKTIEEGKAPQQRKICNICKENFKNSKTLSKHIKSIHHKLKSFICSVCSKKFSRKATLDVRIIIFVATVVRNALKFILDPLAAALIG